MQNSNEIVSLIENLPCRLDRFWKARLLKRHSSLSEFENCLRFCISDPSGTESEQIMAILKEKNVLEEYLTINDS